MKSWNSWLLSLGFAGLSVAFVGCGGGDVPDPDADESSAAAPAEGGGGPAAPPGAVAEKGGAAPGEATVAATAPGAEAAVAARRAGGEAEKGTEAAAKKEEEPAPVAEGSASAAQMLALGNRPLPPPEQPSSAGGAAAPGGANVPGAESAGGSATAPAGRDQPTGQPPGQSEMEQMQAAQRAARSGGQGQEGGLAGGAPGAAGDSAAAYGREGGSGAGAGENGPADFRTPYGAVTAFLNALKAKNAEKLADATARRAATESKSAKNQKLFSSILEQSLTEDDLSELANKLEGFTIVGNNQPKSTGQFSIIVGKTTEDGDYHSRTITTRREKDGWKVMDISGLGILDRPSAGRPVRRPANRPR